MSGPLIARTAGDPRSIVPRGQRPGSGPTTAAPRVACRGERHRVGCFARAPGCPGYPVTANTGCRPRGAFHPPRAGASRRVVTSDSPSDSGVRSRLFMAAQRRSSTDGIRKLALCFDRDRRAAGRHHPGRTSDLPAARGRFLHLPGRCAPAHQRASGQAGHRADPTNVEVGVRRRPLAVRPRPTTTTTQMLRSPLCGHARSAYGLERMQPQSPQHNFLLPRCFRFSACIDRFYTVPVCYLEFTSPRIDDHPEQHHGISGSHAATYVVGLNWGLAMRLAAAVGAGKQP